MNKKELLIIGQSTAGFDAFEHRINKYGDWKIVTAAGDEEAIEKFHRHDFEVVVFAETLSRDKERKLRKIFTFHNPGIIITRHQHGGEKVVVADIMAALDQLRKAKRPSYSLVDDALKNAGLKINIQ